LKAPIPADPTPIAADQIMKVFVPIAAMARIDTAQFISFSSAFIGVGSAGIGASKAF